MVRPVVWITRTPDGATGTAHALEAMGCEAVLAPVLKVVPLKPIIDPHSFDAVILTSRNAVTAFCTLVARRSITAWCVGDATAQAARDARFQTVISAGGDLAALRSLILNTADRHGRLLYAAPREPAGELTLNLRQEGFTISEAAVYETVPVMPRLSPGDMARMTHVLIHSARAGQAVAAAIRAHHDRFRADTLCFICISQAACDGLAMALAGDNKVDDENFTTAFRVRRISPFPDEASMLKLIETTA